MFPGHVSRDGKVCRYFGHVFEDGTCIDGYDELLPGDAGYEKQEVHQSLEARRKMDCARCRPQI
jgi:hypothetical protein